MTEEAVQEQQPRRKVEREVELDLTDQDRVDYANRIGALTTETDKLEVELESTKTLFRETKERIEQELEERELEVRAARIAFRTRRHRKTVFVEEVRNFDRNAMEWWFEGKLVDEKPMTAGERQAEMVLDPVKADDSDEASDAPWLEAAGVIAEDPDESVEGEESQEDSPPAA